MHGVEMNQQRPKGMLRVPVTISDGELANAVTSGKPRFTLDELIAETRPDGHADNKQ